MLVAGGACGAREAGAERALRCGASQVLDYSDSDYQHQLLQLDRFDLVLDSAGVGTSPDSLKPLLSLLRYRGCIVTLSSPLLKNTDSLGLMPGFASSLASLVTLNASSLQERSRYCKLGPDISESEKRPN